MKGVKVFTLIMFFAIIAVPLALFNFKPDAVSKMDDRPLAESPFSANADTSERWTKRTEDYINDRIGLRDQMMLGYTIVNDFAFNKMVHPSYTYGKDGYVFGAGVSTQNDFGDYHIRLADMIQQMQQYCKQRNVSFLLVFDPAKPAILTDKLSGSVNYNRECVDQFLAELDKRGISYVDNTETLKTLSKSGTQVFNKKYDADYWNDTGAFYATLNSLQELKKQNAKVHINDAAEFDVSSKIQTTLPGSKFPINETVPVYTAKTPVKSIASQYSGLPLDKDHSDFDYTVNEQRQKEGAPRALIFQDGYITSYGHKYYENAFSECVQIHSFQNVLDFPSYYNIFKPDCVIFELAEYTMKDEYFSYNRMKVLRFNPQLSTLSGVSSVNRSLPYDAVSIEKNDNYTVINWNTDENADNVWLTLEQEYDMQKTQTGYSVIVPTAEKEKPDVKIQITQYKDGTLYVYS